MAFLAPAVSRETRVKEDLLARLAKKESKDTRVSKATWEKREKGATLVPMAKPGRRVLKALRVAKVPEEKLDPRDPLERRAR